MSRLDASYQISREQAEKAMLSTMLLTQNGIVTYDSKYDYLLQDRLNHFREAYDIAGENIGDINIEQVRASLSEGVEGRLDLFIINKTGCVEYTTYEPDLNKNFSEFPDFSASLVKVREGNEFKSDPWIRSSVNASEYWKYGFLPTKDHQYVLEIGYRNPDAVSTRLDEYEKFKNISRDALEYSGVVYAVVYDIFHRKQNFLDSKNDINFSPDGGIYTSEWLEKTLTETFQKKAGNNYYNKNNYLISVQYINLSSLEAVSSGELSCVSIMIFSLDQMNNTIFLYQTVFVLLTIIAILLGFFLGKYISGYICRPIEIMSEDVKGISELSWDYLLHETGFYETETLRNAINGMVTRLNLYVQEIDNRQDELHHELAMRIKAENSLKLANRRLLQLSQITRHDILNQLNTLILLTDLLEETDIGSKRNELITRIKDTLEKIHTFVIYTCEYEKIGQTELSWNSLEAIVYNGVKLFDIQISIDINKIEILADMLMEKVFYNLVDNTLRHGVWADQISIYFIERDGTGYIIYSDNGEGIVNEKKDFIFKYGYGSGTGIGLFFIHEVLESYGMSISETGIKGTGVRFEIHIPGDKWRYQSDNKKN